MSRYVNVAVDMREQMQPITADEYRLASSGANAVC
jgi:hypothetical protein